MDKKLPIKIRLPDGFLDEEVRFDYVVSSQMKAVWAVELDLLAELTRITHMLGIQFFLDSGSLLGAIRDGAFIPWDDDIDVIMLRNDYDILMNAADQFKSPYFLQNAYTDIEYTRPHAQLRNEQTCAIMPEDGKSVRFCQGIFIDIFVLDGLDVKDLHAEFETIQSFRNPMKYIAFHHSNHFVIEMIKRIRANIFRKKYGDISCLYQNMEDFVRGFDNTQYVDKILFREQEEKIKHLDRRWFSEAIYWRFEFFDCPVPKAYDRVLKAYYGEDYMLPRQEAAMHNENGRILLDARQSYKDYLR